MKVEVIERSESVLEDCDYRNAMDIIIDGKRLFSVSDGEPEDSNMSRDFNCVYNIPEMLKLAYEAGRNGEIFELTESESDVL